MKHIKKIINCRYNIEIKQIKNEIFKEKVVLAKKNKDLENIFVDEVKSL